MVLALGRPADWGALSRVWQGVQAELALPAPAIAVNGVDGYQLWFSLSEAITPDQAQSFLDGLRLRYLQDVAPARVSFIYSAHTAVPQQDQDSGNWSAFVAPDLAPVFADTPWLDIPPSLDGQADLLSRLASIQANDLRQALAQLTHAPDQPKPGIAATATLASTTVVGHYADPHGFLLAVMNNDAVALSLRIEAAKALLPYLSPTERT
jgi:hypothetical protein